MCSLCRLSVAKNHNFWQILTFLGAPVSTPFTDEGQIWRAIADPRSTLTCQISPRSVYFVALWRQKNIFFHILSNFGLWHLVVSPIGSSLRKLNTGAQLQTFPCPMVSKSFLYSNVFMEKSGTQSLTFKSVTKRQTNRQTDKQTKSSTFMATRRRVKSEPHQTWHGDRGPRVRSCTSRILGGLTHSFVARGR